MGSRPYAGASSREGRRSGGTLRGLRVRCLKPARALYRYARRASSRPLRCSKGEVMRRVLFIVFLALAGCAAPRYDIDFDYDTAENWGALKTYDWQPPTGDAVKDELLVKRIRSTVDAGLQKRGFTQSPTPDFLIAMQLSGKKAYGGSTAVGVSVGIPVGWAGRAT